MLVLIAAIASLFPLAWTAEVCCNGGICYNDNPPFQGLPLPTCAERIQISMRVFTRSNSGDGQGQVLTRTTIPPAFMGDKLTIFFVHGFLGSKNNNWLHRMKNDALRRGDYNAVVVGWEGSSQQIWYPQSASDTRAVGMEIGLIAANLISRGDSHQSRLYCVGHSLGSHICGHAGHRTKFGRITGMDPAGPLFENRDWACGLNPSCADFVDVLHTNGKPAIAMNLGTMKQLGHVDFYPNGGGTQPECILDPRRYDLDIENQVDLMPSCSHMRALDYYEESILKDCYLSRHMCNSVNNLPGSCTRYDNPVQTMGFGANNFLNRGIFYLETNAKEPYCRN